MRLLLLIVLLIAIVLILMSSVIAVFTWYHSCQDWPTGVNRINGE
jgi:hypothetical protein